VDLRQVLLAELLCRLLLKLLEVRRDDRLLYLSRDVFDLKLSACEEVEEERNVIRFSRLVRRVAFEASKRRRRGAKRAESASTSP
jgi:hypothetical protein